MVSQEHFFLSIEELVFITYAREFASAVSDSTSTGKVGVAGSQALLVVELSIGLGLGKEIGGEVGVSSRGSSEEDGSSGSTESLAVGRLLHLSSDNDAGSAGVGLCTDLDLGTASREKEKETTSEMRIEE